MCGILVTKNRQGNDKHLKLRGPDQARTIEMRGFVFKHFLLEVTGKGMQPMKDGNIIALINGEIYNQLYKNCDSECVIPLYKEYGTDFVRHLDGEFAIALYDFDKGVNLFATDLFGTKPLWVNGDECASYESGVGGKKIPANTLIVNGVKETVHEFDFQHQHKETYEDWREAFETAVRKRYHPACFLGLSSGYDSGGIDCALKKMGKSYKKYSIEGQENMEILRQRGGQIIKMDAEENDYIDKNVEPYEFTYRINGKEQKKMLHSDKAIYGLGKICRQALKDECKVYLSGQGADEILSDYSPFAAQSELKGQFPDRLAPWYNFFGGQMENYLMKEEMIAGAYGLEARYPYLDKRVVQEFLWLKPELKNRRYKAPLYEYLTRNGYPFKEGEKIGFNPVYR